MKIGIFLMCILYTLIGFAQNQIPSKKVQIETAVQAAPKMFRENAKVLGYDKNGKLITLRKGSNELICLSDDPKKEGFSAACYSDKLEDYMRRGRELVAEGKSTEEKQAARKREIDAGELKMPKEAAMVYVLSADQGDYNSETGALENTHLRYVLYKPYMTVEETGLPDKPQGKGMPWLMDANTHRSHIMITP
ncbi:MAG TPA: hypothetical protein VK021_09345 [Flavobacteriaceae bacterium]|nr:hypothetical protein [Flavobacteriaceae bacterium]